MIKFIVDEAYDGKTLKNYFENEKFSSTQVKRLKYGGEITVNGKKVTVRQILRLGDFVELRAHERLETPTFADTAAKIIYSDDKLYVAEKPHGIACHPDKAHKIDTFGNMLATAFGKNFKLRIITRLDKATSGLVLGALDEITADKLNAMQREHLIRKQYAAETDGIFENDSGTIEYALKRIDAENKTVTDKHGKAAVTEYKVLERREISTLVAAFPITGRTHQIRAHLAAINHPIIGDSLYGGSNGEYVRLQCNRLTFTHPYTKKTVDVSLPLEF